MICHSQRIEILYPYRHHKLTIKEISDELRMNYSSVRTIINAYKKSGRTNKLMTHQAKLSLLKHKEIHQKAQVQNKISMINQKHKESIHIYKEKHQIMSFLLIFDSLTSVCLFFYCLWSWFLACSGLTGVEFIGRNTGYKTNHYDFTFSRIRDNLFKVFGTKSYF